MIIDDDDDDDDAAAAAGGIIAVSVFIGKVQALTHIFCFFFAEHVQIGNLIRIYMGHHAGGVDP